ncbi:hypothetical protein [Neisseria musculi]|uniref:hypothetical protein n=1 Tax=Neisseria musculi TaxID=1815583 RepID=UPI00164C690E|nr:hypothetical protein [Neisseria musculi]
MPKNHTVLLCLPLFSAMLDNFTMWFSAKRKVQGFLHFRPSEKWFSDGLNLGAAYPARAA